VLQALAAHPRIGERATGETREAGWSRHEQSAALDASGEVRRALAAANLAYEQRFGHVFLICATGRSDTEMLTAARARLTHDEVTEQGVVRIELGRIVALRLDRLLDTMSEGAA
ncbi:MAG: hypothetical protein L0Y54_12365, partial [Sporichthyaceae bacterium]|nr:hypothetical protein [Sporichthyaceae bacterium]